MATRSGRVLSERQIKQVAEANTVKIFKISDEHRGSGTGFVVSTDSQRCLIVTNRHVIADMVEVESYALYKATGQRASIRIIDCMSFGTADLALLEANMRVSTSLRISSRRHLVRGDDVYTFGYPGGYPQWVTGKYLFRGDDRSFMDEQGDDGGFSDVCDLPTEPGSSGSAVLDAPGDVIGVVSKGVLNTDASVLVPVGYLHRFLGINDVNYRSNGQMYDDNVSAGPDARPGEYESLHRASQRRPPPSPRPASPAWIERRRGRSPSRALPFFPPRDRSRSGWREIFPSRSRSRRRNRSHDSNLFQDWARRRRSQSSHDDDDDDEFARAGVIVIGESPRRSPHRPTNFPSFRPPTPPRRRSPMRPIRMIPGHHHPSFFPGFGHGPSIPSRQPSLVGRHPIFPGGHFVSGHAPFFQNDDVEIWGNDDSQHSPPPARRRSRSRHGGRFRVFFHQTIV